MTEPRQINPVQLDIGVDDPNAVDFTPRPVPVPKDSSVLAFVSSSPSEARPPSAQSPPQSSSAGSIITLPSSLLNGPSPSSESAETPGKNASAEKAPTPPETPPSPKKTDALIIKPSPNPIPFPKSSVEAPPPAS